MDKIRKLEHFHIFLWLIKDLSWLMNWKALGIFMIFPTLSFAAFIAYKTRNEILNFLPNLAVLFWISANSFWMITEFFSNFEHYKHWAAVPFALGLITIIFFLLNLLRQQPR